MEAYFDGNMTTYPLNAHNPMPPFYPTEILQAKHWDVCSALIRLSFEFALLSQIPTARRLISLLNKYSPRHHDRTIGLRPLWLCWAATGEWPDGEREKAGTDEEIEAMALGWAEYWWYCDPDADAGKTTDVERLKRTLRELDDPKRPHTVDGMPISQEGGWARALELRIKIEREGEGSVADEGIPSLEEMVKKMLGYKWYRRLFETLAESRLVWEAAKTGAIARAVGVDEKKVAELGWKVEETFVKRFREGRDRPTVISMEEMIKEITENTQRNEPAKQQMLENEWLDEETGKTPSLLRDPASEATIIALEERLDIKLPEDFKSFFRVSNGFGQSWNGMSLDPPLFPAEEVRYDDSYDFMEDISLDLIECEIHAFLDSREEREAWPKLGRAIHIGREDTTMVFLLPPATVAKVRDAYFAILESEDSSDGLKIEITTAIEAFCGGVKAFKECEWSVAKWEAMDLIGFSSFGAYMAEKVRNSANPDILASQRSATLLRPEYRVNSA